MANERKDPAEQTKRIGVMVTLLMAEKYPGIENSIGYDIDRDRVQIIVNKSVPIELGPKEWFMSDDELRDLISAKLHNVIRVRLP